MEINFRNIAIIAIVAIAVKLFVAPMVSRVVDGNA